MTDTFKLDNILEKQQHAVQLKIFFPLNISYPQCLNLNFNLNARIYIVT